MATTSCVWRSALLTLSVTHVCGYLAVSLRPRLITENVAEGKQCNMTSTYTGDGFENFCGAAINGNTGTDYISGNCVHSSTSQINPNWTVDLGQEYLIVNITIFARNFKLTNRTTGVTVSVDGVEVYQFGQSGNIQLKTTIPFDPPRSGRYITVARPNRTLLSFCEVQVFAIRGGFENVALHKSCTISSVYPGDGFTNTCSAANNGDVSTTYAKGNCIHTVGNDMNSHWTVNLDQEYAIYRITIYGRSSQFSRMNNVSVSFNGEPPVRTITMSDCNADSYICDLPFWPPRTGQTVTLARHGNQPEDRYLNVCEVQVWVCVQGYYGNNCTEECGVGCQGSTCDSQTGNCTCRSLWQPPLCQACAIGHFNVTSDCQNTCGTGCHHDACNPSDGTCTCKPGWKSPYCNECSQGSYGNDCRGICGAGCSPTNTCNPVNGTCSCADNWQKPLCATCAYGHFNVTSDCQNTCGTGCHNTCDPSNGTCRCKPGWESPYCNTCASGHFAVTSGCQNSCGTGCDDTCDPGNGNCTCKSGWEPPFCNECQDGYYKEGAQCVQCSSNCAARTKCNKDTGKCDSCEAGYHGDKCKLHCTPSGRCLRCDQDTGLCLACSPSSSNLTPPSCTDTAKSEERDGGQQSLVGPVVGSIVGVGLLLTISITAAICWRRRSEENPVRSNNPPIALSDRKTCAPDPPTPASTDARVPAPTADDGLYVEIGGTENTYDKLHPYSNQDAESQQYTQLASDGRDVDTPTTDSAYVNTSLPMGNCHV